MCSTGAQQGWACSVNANAYTATIIPINYDTCHTDASEYDGCQLDCNWNTSRGFKSLHPGGANFLFGDGSVHMLPETIDHQTYQYLGAKADGQPVEMRF